MYLYLRYVLPLALLAAVALGGEPTVTHPVTVVLDFRGPYSARSRDEMKQELQGLVKDSGVHLDWKTREEAAGASDGDMVVVRFSGKCILEPVGYLYDERGTLAYTHTTDGNVLPFSEVSCDQVTASVRSAMFGGDYAQADMLLGRALGRVVAHELVHVLANSGVHGREGVYREALSGRQLIAPKLPLSAQDVKRIQIDHRH